MLLSPLTTTFTTLLLALFQVGLALSVSLIVLLLLCGGTLAGLNTFEVDLPVHDHTGRSGPTSVRQISLRGGSGRASTPGSAAEAAPSARRRRAVRFGAASR